MNFHSKKKLVPENNLILKNNWGRVTYKNIQAQQLAFVRLSGGLDFLLYLRRHCSFSDKKNPGKRDN